MDFISKWAAHVESQVNRNQRPWCRQDIPNPKMHGVGSVMVAGESFQSRSWFRLGCKMQSDEVSNWKLKGCSSCSGLVPVLALGLPKEKELENRLCKHIQLFLSISKEPWAVMKLTMFSTTLSLKLALAEMDCTDGIPSTQWVCVSSSASDSSLDATWAKDEMGVPFARYSSALPLCQATCWVIFFLCLVPWELQVDFS